jgi:hypothetical protein
MPRRRQSVAPQSEIQVLRDEIKALSRQVTALKQAGPSTIQTDDWEKALDPVQGELMIHHPGSHVPAEPTDPIVYYHDGEMKKIGGAPGVEWTETISGTDWGTDFTILDFGTIVDPDNYDALVPTFDVNANGNIEIFKAGIYILALGVTGTTNVNKMNLIKLRIDFISGETPEGMHTWNTAWYNDTLAHIGSVGLFNETFGTWPDYWDFFSYSSNSFDIGTLGPGEIEIAVYKEEDGVGVADAVAQVRLLLIRLGSHFS